MQVSQNVTDFQLASELCSEGLNRSYRGRRRLARAMDLIRTLSVAASGLRAQAGRMRVIAENLANAEFDLRATGPTAIPIAAGSCRSATLDPRSALGPYAAMTASCPTARLQPRYDPRHPAADAEGYVLLPNVNPLVEMMDMKEGAAQLPGQFGRHRRDAEDGGAHARHSQGVISGDLRHEAQPHSPPAPIAIWPRSVPAGVPPRRAPGQGPRPPPARASARCWRMPCTRLSTWPSAPIPRPWRRRRARRSGRRGHRGDRVADGDPGAGRRPRPGDLGLSADYADADLIGPSLAGNGGGEGEE